MSSVWLISSSKASSENQRDAETKPDKKKALAKDANTIIIEEYIRQYAPVDAYGAGVSIRTTADIINELADMADLDQDEVNDVLIREGYRPGRNSAGSFGWMMRQM